jgi:hypothetical protein
METKSDMKKSVNSVSGLRIEQVSGSVESPTDGVHVEITTEESSQPMGGATSSTSSAGDREEDDETLPTLSSEQLARRPSFKSVGILYCKHSNFPEEAEGLHVQCRADQIILHIHSCILHASI